MTPVRIRLREARLARGLSQVRLAELAGVRQATVNALENGKTRGVEFATLDALARVLEMAPEMLLTSVPEAPPEKPRRQAGGTSR